MLRGFVLVAKVIQNTVNGVMFSEKEPYMMKLNKYMEKALPEVSRFLQEISQRVRLTRRCPIGHSLISQTLNASAQPVVVKISDIQENEAATRLDNVLHGNTQLQPSRSNGNTPTPGSPGSPH